MTSESSVDWIGPELNCNLCLLIYFQQTSLLRWLPLLLLLLLHLRLLTPPCIRRIPVHTFPHFALFISPFSSLLLPARHVSHVNRRSGEYVSFSSLGGSGTIFSGIIMRALLIGGKWRHFASLKKKRPVYSAAHSPIFVSWGVQSMTIFATKNLCVQ